MESNAASYDDSYNDSYYGPYYNPHYNSRVLVHWLSVCEC